MTSSFVCATLNLGRKKSTGTEPIHWTQSMPSRDVNAATRLTEASWNTVVHVAL